MPESEEEKRPRSKTDQEEIAELKKAVKMMAARFISFRAEADQAHTEDTRYLLQFKHEVASLRAALTEAQTDLVAVKTSVEAVKSLYTSQSVAIIRVRDAIASQGNAIVSACRRLEDIQTARKAAESQHQRFATFADEEKLKRDAFESELHAQLESRMASLTMEINKSREEQEQTKNAIAELKKKSDVSEDRDSQRQMIFFEMIEGETLKREELTTSIEAKWSKCEIDLQQLAASVKKLCRKEEEDRCEQEESLLWFQEEIQRQLHELGDEVNRNLSRYDGQLKEMHDKQRSRSQVFDEPVVETNKQQDDTKRLLRDQYLQLTVQIREVRDFVNSGLERERREIHELRESMNSGLEKERHDRSHELTTLLQTIQQLVAIG